MREARRRLLVKQGPVFTSKRKVRACAWTSFAGSGFICAPGKQGSNGSLFVDWKRLFGVGGLRDRRGVVWR